MTDIRSDMSRVLTLVRRYKRQQISWRRHLHRYPELSFEEFETTAYLKRTVRTLGLRLLPIKLKTGLLAEVQGLHPGPTVAIRSDIDALPVPEQTSLSYKSRREGCMHACGHDVHMAVVLGAAAVLTDMKPHLRGNVRFIFQPGEETPPGGARPMIDSGALDSVAMILGLHTDPQVGTGRIGLRDGVTMASVTDFDLDIYGRSGHAARPHLAVDAVSAAAEVIESVQKVISREIDPATPATVSFGTIDGGVARNVIAEHVRLQGTARAMTVAIARTLPRLIGRTARAICRARGARVEMKTLAGYPVLKNDPAINRLLARNYRSLFGNGRIALTEATLGAEDFSCYLQQVPGAMFRLGIRNPAIGANRPWHSAKFVADEEALPYGTALLVAAAMDFLNSQQKD